VLLNACYTVDENVLKQRRNNLMKA